MLQTRNLEEGEAIGSGMVPFERALVSSMLSIHSNFSSIFMRVRHTAAFVLQHATFSLPHL